MPKVSVIMPMYNSVKYVRQAIESLLAQTYTDLEIIAINDGSKDGCADVVRNIKDDRLIFVDRENRGFVNTLNECIEMASGEYIARLDDDDWCYPTRIEKQVAYLDTHADTVLVGTLNDEQLDNQIRRKPKSCVVTPNQIRYALVFGNYAFAHSSFMMRRNVLNDHQIRYEVFKQVPDYHMITQLSSYGEIARIQEYLTVYRIHATQSTRVRSAQMKTGEIDRARAWFIDTLPLEEPQKTALKKGVLRKLNTREDLVAFDGALSEYRRQCKIDDNQDKNCIRFLYKQCMLQQYCTPHLLIACLKGGTRSWLFSIEGMKFIIKCLIRHNPYYLETDAMMAP